MDIATFPSGGASHFESYCVFPKRVLFRSRIFAGMKGKRWYLGAVLISILLVKNKVEYLFICLKGLFVHWFLWTMWLCLLLVGKFVVFHPSLLKGFYILGTLLQHILGFILLGIYIFVYNIGYTYSVWFLIYCVFYFAYIDFLTIKRYILCNQIISLFIDCIWIFHHI